MQGNKEKEQLEKLARSILDFLGYNDFMVEVSLVDGKTMRSLNRRFKGKDYTTNILSFQTPKEFPDVPDKNFPHLLGEIYLDLKCIEKRKEDVNYLLIHGLLHLLDFNHKQYDDRIKMERKEKEIIIYLLSNS